MFSKQNADELQSRVIAFLRFPLIVGVVFIHNYRPSIIVGNEVMGSETHMPTYSFIGQLFSQYIGWISVPLFFCKLPILGYPLLDGRQSAPV